MKPDRDASKLAARLSAAASTPLPLPEASAATPTPEARPGKQTADTVAITLRPSRALLNRFTLAAAERTREVGRVISAQEMMLEQLERAS